MTLPLVYHIPVCPFSQRLEILLALKGKRDAVQFQVVDITRPRPERLLQLSRGTTALPIMELADGHVLKESMVLLQYLDETLPEKPVAQRDPYRRAVENMLCRMEGEFTTAGYTLVMNQDATRRGKLHESLLAIYARLSDFLSHHSTGDSFLFEEFGWAECVFTPMFMRFWFNEYYEGFELPAGDARYTRVAQWVQACIAHPAAQQVTREEIVKLYYDYARGAGNGAPLPGRTVSSFAFSPSWKTRPWPPHDKYGPAATDAQLGLVAPS
ncbi:glutathione S-transferase family protein [Caenimonas koreensis]|uniref:Glutathione S-transferase family protein n=1 Tax=Caenimonas koreensis DSM 17982 TaxID=1121255 RepID=A0A844BA94_9BURK|nr:glutathione S-transferase family protein [Caenimonas koreensis]MRD48456.1 glutathione S-transferase family protein [Caenimonas koreensis DSM 17982]